MAMNHSERQLQVLENYFKRKNKQAISELESMEEVMTTDEIVNLLFTFLFQHVTLLTTENDVEYFYNAINYITVILETYSDVNRKKIGRKLRKLAEKMDRIQEEYNPNDKKIKNRFSKVHKLILEIDLQNKEKENNYYSLFEYVIFELKNIEYVEQIVKLYPNVLNLNDRDKCPIFFHILEKLLEEMNKSKDLECNQNILYYTNVLSFFISKPEFNLKEEEQKECLELVYDNLNQLQKKDIHYKKKLQILEKLKEIVLNEDRDCNIRKIATYYGINIDFDEILVQQLKMHKTEISKSLYPDRNIIDDYMITIDKPNTIEIDDGLTAKKLPNDNYLLGIHIASVLGYLPFSSNAVQTAIKRASSIYLPYQLDKKESNNDEEYKKLIPIFPYSFSAVTASLLEKEYRLANSYLFEISNDGEIINQEFKKTIVKNRKKCTYDEINNIIEHGSKNQKLQETVNNLNNITYLLDKSYQTSDLYEEVKRFSNDAASLKLGYSRAEKIVNRAMILTGSKVADFFAHSKRQYPCLYRVHYIDEEVTKKLDEVIKSYHIVANKNKFDYIHSGLLGLYPKAFYDIRGSHDGLNLKHYCHPTSPTRRAADIIVEHCLDVCYFNEPSDEELYNLERTIMMNKNKLNAKNNDIDYFLNECVNQHQKIKCKK